MKKIGIITFHKAYNYGAVLQLYALKNYLSNRYDVSIIDYDNKFLYKNHKLFHPIRKNLIKFIKDIFLDVKNLKRNMKRINKFKKFLEKNFKFITIDDEDKMEIVITGSDQVWNYNITGKLDEFYTLNNLKGKNVKKISYAASVGSASIISTKELEYKEKLSGLDCISVRERDAEEYLEKILNKDIETVLDPTLLLTKEQWDKLLLNNIVKDEDYILAYVVEEDKDYIDVLNYLVEKTGLKVIHFSNKNLGIKNILKSAYSDGPIDFINLIKNAKYIVSTSFHATVFSIIYNKDFWVIPHKKTGMRVMNLLKLLSLEDRAVNNVTEIEDKIFSNINYKEVNEKLDFERKKSINWLEDAING